MKLVPLGDRVVLKQCVAEETTKSGIVIPGQSKEKPQQAEVIAVAPSFTMVYDCFFPADMLTFYDTGVKISSQHIIIRK